MNIMLGDRVGILSLGWDTLGETPGAGGCGTEGSRKARFWATAPVLLRFVLSLAHGQRGQVQGRWRILRIEEEAQVKRREEPCARKCESTVQQLSWC